MATGCQQTFLGLLDIEKNVMSFNNLNSGSQGEGLINPSHSILTDLGQVNERIILYQNYSLSTTNGYAPRDP